MTDSVIWTFRGAEISERSDELIVPEEPPGTAAATRWSSSSREASNAAPVGGKAVATSVATEEATADRAADDGAENAAPWHAATNSRWETTVNENATQSFRETVPEAARSEGSDPRESATRGTALPGDRGPGNGASSRDQRPSFWRRIALGRRGASEGDPGPDRADRSDRSRSEEGTLHRTRQLAARIAASATPTPSAARPDDVAREVEKRIVEPMLQALVSVESKLERSHVDLLGRSDVIEQRLSQLWDIDEQLGTLGELQESLQRVSEQQRRLESAIQAQTQALRWVIGAVAVSLAVVAFVVATILR